MRKPLLLFAVILTFVVSGCGEQPAPDAAAGQQTTDAVPPDQGTNASQTGLGDTIALPDGWAMNDAVSAAEVEAIMGMAGFAPFPEAASNAASGKPVGSFNIGSVPYSKVRFEVDVAGGRSGFDTAVSFLDNPVEVQGAMWDAAMMGDVPQGDRMPVRIVGYRGSLSFHITWEPAVFPTLDRQQTSVRLAELLLTNLYTQR